MLHVTAALSITVLVTTSRPILLWIVFTSEETADIAAHIEECCVLVVERRALVRYTVVHRMVA